MGDHLLGSYLRSFLAILLAQFSAKGSPGGMDGVVRFAEKSPPIQVRPFPNVHENMQCPGQDNACWERYEDLSLTSAVT